MAARGDHNIERGETIGPSRCLNCYARNGPPLFFVTLVMMKAPRSAPLSAIVAFGFRVAIKVPLQETAIT